MTMTEKFSSGRWLLTMFSGIVLMGMAYADVHVAIARPEATMPFSPEALFAIISSVSAFYFSKPTENTPKQ